MAVLIGLASPAAVRALGRDDATPRALLDALPAAVRVLAGGGATARRRVDDVADALAGAAGAHDVVLCGDHDVLRGFATRGDVARCRAVGVVVRPPASPREGRALARRLHRHLAPARARVVVTTTDAAVRSLTPLVPPGTSVLPTHGVAPGWFALERAPRPGRPVVAVRGGPHRDLALIVEAIAPLDVTVEVGVDRPVATSRGTTIPPAMSPDLHVHRLDRAGLVALHARATIVAVPLVRNDEGAGLRAVTEAMAAGGPVVVSVASPEIAALVREGVVLGVRPRDLGQLRRAVTMLVDHPERADALGRAGRSFAAAHFAIEDRCAAAAAVLGALAPRHLEPVGGPGVFAA
jgi:glycosyltransferase involved in cell wall biosynthesis